MKLYQKVMDMSMKRLSSAPTLNTVLMIEETLQRAGKSAITIAELKRQLPRQVNHNVLKTVLAYLEESHKILFGLKGITWIHNTNPRLRRALRNGLEL